MAETIYQLPENLGNAVVQYLSKQPYAEVFQLIVALQQLEKSNKKGLSAAFVKSRMNGG